MIIELLNRVKSREVICRAPMVRRIKISNPITNECSKDWDGLIDTGSDHTIIPIQVAERLRLEVVEDDGLRIINPGDGSTTVWRYLKARLLLCNKEIDTDRILASDIDYISLGRDVLQHANLVINWQLRSVGTARSGRTRQQEGKLTFADSSHFKTCSVPKADA